MGKPNTIQLLVNYWELRPAQIAQTLDDLVQRGIQQVSTTVPWQYFESDISHSLMRFLHLAYERNMHVALILSPDLGLHYSCSGLPKDVLQSSDVMARHSRGGEISVLLPPQQFAIPSLFSSDFTKRYYGYLARLNVFFSDLERSQRGILEHITIFLTGSFWKYYRPPQSESLEIFSSSAGDRSKSAILAYRTAVEEYFNGPEFSSPNPAAAGRWKVQELDEVNRRWFHQHAEDRFRIRTEKILRKNDVNLKIRHIENHVPEADPAYHYSGALRLMIDGKADFHRLSELVDAYASRRAAVETRQCIPYTFWTSLGPFRSLSDSEKQFLLLKSLLLMGGSGGGIFIEDREWFSFSQAFRSRIESLSQSLMESALRLPSQVIYLTPHLWSAPASAQQMDLWRRIQALVGHSAQVAACLDYSVLNEDVELLIVDSQQILSVDRLKSLLSWARKGRVLCLPKTRLYSDAALEEFESWQQSNQRQQELDLGIPCSLHRAGTGKVIVYEMPDPTLSAEETQAAWNYFAEEILRTADIPRQCGLSDARLSTLTLSRDRTSSRGVGLFVLNDSNRMVSGDIFFSESVCISDLHQSLSHPVNRNQCNIEEGNRFTLDVPPCGVLPLSVEGSIIDKRERKMAERMSFETENFALDSAMSELQGFVMDDSGMNVEPGWGQEQSNADATELLILPFDHPSRPLDKGMS